MKKIIIFSVAVLFSSTLFAQLGLDLKLNRRVYMQYEHIYALVTIRNDTGRPLLFGKDPRLQGFVLFEVRNSANRVVSKRKNAPEINVTGLILKPGEVKKMILPLHRYYNLDRADSYRVYVFVSHNMLESEYRSSEQLFQISKGTQVWQRKVGIPDLEGKRLEPVKERIYTIRAMAEGGVIYYYLVVEDDKHIFGVCKIGQKMGYEKFSAETDMLSRLHLLMPVSPRVFHYLAFSLDGHVIANNYWKIEDTIPMLYRDPTTGKVTRMGGALAKSGIDYQDPSAGKIKVSQLLREDEQSVTPRPQRDNGPVDLGRGL